MSEEALFHMVPTRVRLRAGQHVHVQTIWGKERGLVLGVSRDLYPQAHLLMDNGDEVFISVSRVVEIEDDQQ